MPQRTRTNHLLFICHGWSRAATHVTIFGLRSTPRELADGALLGWLSLLLINAVFLTRLKVDLTPEQNSLRHVFEIGQLLGLAFLTWVAHRLLLRFEGRTRTALAFCLLAAGTYGLLGGDLQRCPLA